MAKEEKITEIDSEVETRVHHIKEGEQRASLRQSSRRQRNEISTIGKKRTELLFEINNKPHQQTRLPLYLDQEKPKQNWNKKYMTDKSLEKPI